MPAITTSTPTDVHSIRGAVPLTALGDRDQRRSRAAPPTTNAASTVRRGSGRSSRSALRSPDGSSRLQSCRARRLRPRARGRRDGRRPTVSTSASRSAILPLAGDARPARRPRATAPARTRARAHAGAAASSSSVSDSRSPTTIRSTSRVRGAFDSPRSRPKAVSTACARSSSIATDSVVSAIRIALRKSGEPVGRIDRRGLVDRRHRDDVDLRGVGERVDRALQVGEPVADVAAERQHGRPDRPHLAGQGVGVDDVRVGRLSHLGSGG